MVRTCSGADLPRADENKFYLLRSYGSSAREIWDVTDPAKPSRVTVVLSGLRGLVDSHSGLRRLPDKRLLRTKATLSRLT
jgi:hypothetical protein